MKRIIGTNFRLRALLGAVMVISGNVSREAVAAPFRGTTQRGANVSTSTPVAPEHASTVAWATSPTPTFVPTISPISTPDSPIGLPTFTETPSPTPTFARPPEPSTTPTYSPSPGPTPMDTPDSPDEEEGINDDGAFIPQPVPSGTGSPEPTATPSPTSLPVCENVGKDSDLEIAPIATEIPSPVNSDDIRYRN